MIVLDEELKWPGRVWYLIERKNGSEKSSDQRMEQIQMAVSRTFEAR